MSAKTNEILLSLRENKGQTARDLGVTGTTVRALAKEGLVKQVSTRKHTDREGNVLRGRPAHEYALTKRGNDRARRLVAKQPVAA